MGKPNPFVVEQADSIIRNHQVQLTHYFIENGIFKGYIKALFQLPNIIKSSNIDIVHVHNGLSAFVVILSKILFFLPTKVVITFHGSDLNDKSKRKYSLFASRFASHNILVSEKMIKFLKSGYSVVPCGIDTDILLEYRDITRMQKSWNDNDFIILFSSNFERKEKDPQFAFEVVEAFSKTTDKNVVFIELKGYNREELTQIMQAADVLILCSTTEGSPQVIKESIINSLPVVSNDVGDVADICSGVDNCFIVKKDVTEFVNRLAFIANHNVRVRRRYPVIKKYNNTIISQKLFHIYNEALK